MMWNPVFQQRVWGHGTPGVQDKALVGDPEGRILVKASENYFIALSTCNYKFIRWIDIDLVILFKYSLIPLVF